MSHINATKNFVGMHIVVRGVPDLFISGCQSFSSLGRIHPSMNCGTSLVSIDSDMAAGEMAT
jgi:hypothetical protein